MNIRMDESHRYWVGEPGIEVPGVSHILKTAGEKSGWEVRNLDWYKTRGSFVHKAAALDDAGMLDVATVDPQVLPYLTAWRKFKETYGVKVLVSEQIVYCEELKYAGTFDRIIVSDMREGAEILLDLKTGGKASWHHLQVAAYFYAKWGMDLDRALAGILYLTNKGTYKMDLLSPLVLARAIEKWKDIVARYRSDKEVDLWAELK